MKTKTEKLAAALCDLSEAALIVSPQNIRYFTGFCPSEGALFINKGACVLLVDFRYGEAAKAKVRDARVVVYESLRDSLRELIMENSIKTCLFECRGMSLYKSNLFESFIAPADCKADKSEKLDKLIMLQRVIKTDDELKNIRKAASITDDAFSHILSYIREGVAEYELALEIEFYMRKNGAEKVAFDLITITGQNTSLPHGVPGTGKVKKGDFITLDIGAVFDGYHSDMTRTVALGSVSDKQKMIYETVLKAQKSAICMLKEGVICKDADKASRDIIDSAGFARFFGHSVGHGVGLEILEEPSIAPKSDTILSPGMIVTVEPGIYLPGEFGVRIEDMVCIEKDGIENLTHSEKGLIIL